MPHSHHSHSGQFCKHAVGSLEQIVLQAIEHGFEVYGLTEHVPRYRRQDLYPEEIQLEVHSLSATFDDFVVEANRLKMAYANRISLMVGLETEYITKMDLDSLSEVLARHGNHIDYIVGSIHHVNGIPIDFDEEQYRKAVDSCHRSGSLDLSSSGNTHSKITRFFECYFDAQYSMLTSHHPEVIGHIDLCRLYTPHLNFHDHSSVIEKVTRNVNYAIGYGAVFEVNAAAFRKGWNTAYPGRELFELILRNGGRFVLSDDSHGPHAVGLNYDKLFHYLHTELKLTELYYLRPSRTPLLEANRGRGAVEIAKVEGDWWQHKFWATKS